MGEFIALLSPLSMRASCVVKSLYIVSSLVRHSLEDIRIYFAYHVLGCVCDLLVLVPLSRGVLVRSLLVAMELFFMLNC